MIKTCVGCYGHTHSHNVWVVNIAAEINVMCYLEIESENQKSSLIIYLVLIHPVPI